MAFEPQRLVFQALCANLALNNIANALAFQQAVGSEAGTTIVPVLDPNLAQNFGRVALGESESGDEVPVVALDEYDLPSCRLLKVDVEGMELDVLAGARQTIERCAPIIYVENDRKEKSDELIRYIADMGYQMYWHRPPLYHPDNFFGNKENVFRDLASRNMLCALTGAQILGLNPVQVPLPPPPQT